MLSLEQETREEMTVTSVYYNALTTDNALLSLNTESSVTSFGLKQLTSKVSHLQTTGKKLLKTQENLIGFCTDFVREIRSSCEKWEKDIDEASAENNAEEEEEEKDQTEDEKLKIKAVKDSEKQMREDAARGLRMVMRQLNKKRIEINSDIAKEREKLFKVMENAKTIMTAVDTEMKKIEGLSKEEDKVFSEEEIDEQKDLLKKAYVAIRSFFEEQEGIEKESADTIEISKLEESIEISDGDLSSARSLGVGSGKILNKQMTANFGSETASSGRFNCKTKIGGWVGGNRGGEQQHLQIDLKRQAIITSVTTQGLFVEKEDSTTATTSIPTTLGKFSPSILG